MVYREPKRQDEKSSHWDEIKHIRHTVSYCKYGDTRMKPTDIWTNNLNWQPKPMCKPFKYDYSSNPEGEVVDRHCHHDASPRGTQNGGTKIKETTKEVKSSRTMYRNIKTMKVLLACEESHSH